MPEKMPDVIVLLPGITGSELTQDGRTIWGWSGRALLRNLLTLGDDLLTRLSVAGDSPVDESLDDRVIASRLLPDLHALPGVWKIDGYGAVADFIKAEFDVVEHENFFPFPYDWRRDNRSSARTLKRRTDEWLHRWRAKSGNADAKLILVAHSMGGLVSRYFLEVLEGWRDTRALITFGTPFRGSLSAVDALSNGVRALGVLDLTPLCRDLNSLHQLLPTYPCVDAGDGQLQSVVDANLPNMQPARVRDAFEFHEEIRRVVEVHQQDELYRLHRYRVYPIVGYRQPTGQSALVRGEHVEIVNEHHGSDLGGDGTVPRPSAMPLEQIDAASGMFAATRHASLQNAEAVLTHLAGVISGLYLPLGDFRGVRPRLTQLSLDIADIYRAGEPVIARARPTRADVEIGATFGDVESGQDVARLPMVMGADGWFRAEFMPPRAGAYRVVVSGSQRGVEPAADVFEVVDAQ